MATSSNSTNVDAGGSTQTGIGGEGGITGGGTPGVDFNGPNPNQPANIVGNDTVNGSYSYIDSSSQADPNAAARAEAERRRIAAENKAKEQAKDRKIAQDAVKAQRDRRDSSVAKSTAQPRDNRQQPAQAREATTMTSRQQPEDTRRAEQQQDQDSMQAHIRRAPGGQLYNNETGEVVEQMAANNLQDTRLAPVEPTSPQEAQRGAVIGRAGQSTPGAPVVSASTQIPGYNAAPNVPNAPQAPQARNASNGQAVQSGSNPQQVEIVSQPTTRERADAIFYRDIRRRQKEANEANEQLRRNYDQWIQESPPGVAESSYFPEWLIDEEAFGNEAEPLMKSNYRTLDQYEEGQESPGPVLTEKDTRRQDRMIDNIVRDMELGFFHITTERINKDENTGEETVRWSEPVEDAMTNVMEYFGLHGIEGQRTVFRLVRMYASMGVDSNGKMFNQDADQWSLNESEFITICNFIIRSCIEHGHPMAMPFQRWQLRGTDIYPSGVMPKTIAQAITGPDSNLRMSPADLVQMCQDEWNGRTYPTMKANLYRDDSEDGGHNEIAQRIAIERMQQAISRLDGVSTEDFSRRYGVDTTLHYKLSEYEDQLAEYATATNGNYDSDKVLEKQRERIDFYKREAMKQKGVKFHVEETDQLTEEIVIEGTKYPSYVQAGANLITSIARINSILSRPILAIASLNEKAVGNLRTKFGIDILDISFKSFF